MMNLSDGRRRRLLKTQILDLVEKGDVDELVCSICYRVLH